MRRRNDNTERPKKYYDITLPKGVKTQDLFILYGWRAARSFPLETLNNALAFRGLAIEEYGGDSDDFIFRIKKIPRVKPQKNENFAGVSGQGMQTLCVSGGIIEKGNANANGTT